MCASGDFYGGSCLGKRAEGGRDGDGAVMVRRRRGGDGVAGREVDVLLMEAGGGLQWLILRQRVCAFTPPGTSGA